MNLLIVVNRPGIQVRRAEALAQVMADRVNTTILVASSLSEVFENLQTADVLYVIDPGRKGLPSAMAGCVKRIPTVVEFGDPQAALYRAQGRNFMSIFAGYLADSVSVRTPRHAVLRGKGLAEALRIRIPWTFIPDGVDMEMFRPQDSAQMRGKLGINDSSVVVGLVGSLNLSRKPPHCYGWELIEALAHLRNTQVIGLVVGGGPGREWLRRRALALGVADQVLLPGLVHHTDVAEYICAMDICVSTQTNDAIGRSRTTSKLPEYLACNRHILATDVGTAGAVLPREMLIPFEGSWDPSYPSRLADRVIDWLQSGRSPRVHTRRIAATEFDYQVLGDRLCDVLEAVG